MSLQCGDTFFFPKSGSSIEHLDESETTIVLTANEHEFIKHESVVHFADAREIDLELVEKLLARRTQQFVAQIHKPCSEKLLARIRAGLLQSTTTPKEIKRKYQISLGALDFPFVYTFSLGASES